MLVLCFPSAWDFSESLSAPSISTSLVCSPQWMLLTPSVALCLFLSQHPDFCDSLQVFPITDFHLTRCTFTFLFAHSQPLWLEHKPVRGGTETYAKWVVTSVQVPTEMSEDLAQQVHVSHMCFENCWCARTLHRQTDIFTYAACNLGSNMIIMKLHVIIFILQYQPESNLVQSKWSAAPANRETFAGATQENNVSA